MYTFKCGRCGTACTEMRRLGDFAATRCPACGGAAPHDMFADPCGVGIIDYVGEAPTLGQQAERNMRKFGRELTARKRAEQRGRGPGPSAPD